MASTTNVDLSSMTAKQLRNVCTARGMTPVSWDIKKLISQIESGAPAPGGCLYSFNDTLFEQSITHAPHISGQDSTLAMGTDVNPLFYRQAPLPSCPPGFVNGVRVKEMLHGAAKKRLRI